MARTATTGAPAPASPGREAAAIEVVEVSKRFGRTRALDRVSMTVDHGEARALVGRNGAGKSTLVSLLTGIARPDSGTVRIAGGPAATGGNAVGCVYQRSGMVPALSVAENVTIRDYPRLRAGVVSWRRIRADARRHLEGWGIEHLADTPVEQIDPVQAKVVEICRALIQRPSVLLLDEPTAGLDKRDAERLFAIVDRLKAQGVTLLYVSHHLDEIYRLCDSATVLRDARHVVSSPLDRLPMSDLVAAMVGKDAPPELTAHTGAARPVADLAADATAARPRLRIEGLSAGVVEDFGLEVRAGECVGIAGLDGSGKSEVGRVLAGLQRPAAGSVVVDGERVAPASVRASLRAGIAYVPEDRHARGMVPQLDVSENATMTAARRLSRRLVPGLPRVLLPADRDRVYDRLAAQWQVVAASARQLIGELSGGNQQKCVMARAVATDPAVLVMQNPTAGIDVAAKVSITTTLREIFAGGACGVVISEDPDDFALCSRILVLVKGQAVERLEGDWTEGDLVSAMQGADK